MKKIQKAYMRLRNKKTHILSYALGGGLAALLDLGLLFLFTERAGLYYLYSAVCAFVCSLIFGFFFQKYITFGDKSNMYVRQGSRFVLYQLVGQGIYMGLLRVGVDIYAINYMLVAVGAKGIVFVWNFYMNYFYNFAHRGKHCLSSSPSSMNKIQ